MTNKPVKEVGSASVSSVALTVENLAAARGLRVLFAGLNFQLGKADALELRGPNGSGKSTLLRILAGLTRQHAGTVKFSDGEDVLRHYLGHSDAVKPTETAAEQARFWARYFGRKDAAAREAFERVGLSQRSDVPGRGLSAGQKRRLALTRLLLDPRPIWLLDEPTAALDAETEHALFERYSAAAHGGPRGQSGRITILVSHRFSTVRMADLIVVLDGARLVEFGTHDELMVKGGQYSELYSIQAEAYRR